MGKKSKKAIKFIKLDLKNIIKQYKILKNEFDLYTVTT